MTLRILTAILGLTTGAAFAADRVALVIGNDAYQHARPLHAAVNDASAVAQTLQRLGFDTISASDAGLEQMVEAMTTLRKKAVGAQAVLVYYAGHGIESDGANYLIPVDAKLEREIQLETQAVRLDAVLSKLNELKVPARMIILDCCRDNPLEGRTWLATRGGGGGLGNLDEENLAEATLVVYSASPGKPALDRITGTDRHSPFTQALLDELPKGGSHSFEVFGRIEEEVIRRTEARQKPRIFYNGSTLPFRSFRFVTAPIAEATPSAMVIAPPPAEINAGGSLQRPRTLTFDKQTFTTPIRNRSSDPPHGDETVNIGPGRLAIDESGITLTFTQEVIMIARKGRTFKDGVKKLYGLYDGRFILKKQHMMEQLDPADPYEFRKEGQKRAQELGLTRLRESGWILLAFSSYKHDLTAGTYKGFSAAGFDELSSPIARKTGAIMGGGLLVNTELNQIFAFGSGMMQLVKTVRIQDETP